MNITAQQIFKESAESCGLIALKGLKTANIASIAPFQNCKKGDLVFIPDQKALQACIEQGASIIVVPANLEAAAEANGGEMGILVCANIGIAHAKLKQKYGDHDYGRAGWENIHASAVIHNSVKVPKGAIIGPHVVIEQGVVLGDRCHIMANVVIEHDAIIGTDVRIHPGTVIGWSCEVGDECLILSNTTIGGEGFGYAQDQYFNHHRIPQTGNVVIGKKVTVGANCTIDRGTYGSTTIGDGCIFDNLCHIAHNVTIGQNCIGLSGFLCAGSTTIGSRVVASGGAMIKDHVTICDDVYLMHRAGVVKDIKQPGMYAGGPVLPMKDYVKSNAIYGKLGELRQTVQKLSKIVSQKLGGV